MSTKYSDQVANNQSDPIVLNTPQHGGRERVMIGSFELAATDLQSDDIIHLCKLPANAIITGLWIQNDDLDSHGTPTAACDVGLYDNSTTPAVADVDAFASAITTLQAATATWTDILGEAGAVPKAKIGKKLYEWAGDSQGDFSEYWISMTFTASAATGAAGTLAYKVSYILN